MSTISINIADMSGQPEWYEIGYAGVAPDTTFSINVQSWRTAYPSGVISMDIRRPDGVTYPRVIRRVDGGTYPCTITESGGVVTYAVTSSDVAVCGSGYLQLKITQGSTVMASVILKIYVEWSQDTSGGVPPEYAAWVQQVLDARIGADAAAAAAEVSRIAVSQQVADLGLSVADGSLCFTWVEA